MLIRERLLSLREMDRRYRTMLYNINLEVCREIFRYLEVILDKDSGKGADAGSRVMKEIGVASLDLEDDTVSQL